VGPGKTVAVVGDGAETLAAQLEKVYAVEHELLKQYTPDAYSAALRQLLAQVKPQYVLFPHTYQVRDFAPKLATRFNQVLVSDVISVRWESGSPVFVRLLFQGKLNGDVRVSGSVVPVNGVA
jgi:electron transfer flavoprotein alpha subunit